MRRFLYVMMTVFVMVCFCGTPFSVAGDVEEAVNALDLGVQRAAPGAIADKNYIQDVWVSTSSSADSTAVRVIPSGTSPYLHVNYYLTAACTVVRYWVVGNAAGSLAYFQAFSSDKEAGEGHLAVVLPTTLSPGAYFGTVAMTVPDNNMMSPTPYWFVIE